MHLAHPSRMQRQRYCFFGKYARACIIFVNSASFFVNNASFFFVMIIQEKGHPCGCPLCVALQRLELASYWRFVWYDGDVCAEGVSDVGYLPDAGVVASFFDGGECGGLDACPCRHFGLIQPLLFPQFPEPPSNLLCCLVVLVVGLNGAIASDVHRHFLHGVDVLTDSPVKVHLKFVCHNQSSCLMSSGVGNSGG